MERAQLPLNALRAFDASARHLNFTRAAAELCVSQGAISHQVARLEARLDVKLFRRLPRGLALTDEGLGLAPVLSELFDRMSATLARYQGDAQEVLTVGVVGAFAAGWLLPRLAAFRADCPQIDLRLMTNNNRVDLAGEGLDFAIRYGDGAWHGVDAEPVMDAPLSPVCAPALQARLATPADLTGETLLRSFRADEWPAWFHAAGAACPPLRGPVFDSSTTMAATAAAGLGVALVPVAMFGRDLNLGHLVRPFDIEITTGRYWLTRLKSREDSPAMVRFRGWLRRAAG